MQIIDDEYIKREFRNSRGMTNYYRLKRATKEELEYLINRYKDSNSINETLIRIYNNYEIHPLCPICGNPVELFRSNWRTYCSKSCHSKGNILKIEKKYGTKSTLVLNEVKEKSKQTLINNYNVDNPMKSKEIQEKSKQTCLKKYGVEYSSQSNIIKEKTKQTCLQKYDSEYYLTSKDCKEKTILKLGTDNYRKTKECKQKVSKYNKDNKDQIIKKRKQTCLEKYGVDNPMKVEKIKEKSKQTCLQKYGTNTFSQSIEYQKWLINHKEDIELWKLKSYNTKKKNGTLGGPKSKMEDISYNLIKEKFPDVIRQYKTDRYPFLCDFYIPNLDLFIECQYHPSHGLHPFNKDDINDILLSKKLHNSKFGDYIWTIKDPYKRKIAKENKLNYLEFFNISELKDWLNKKEVNLNLPL